MAKLRAADAAASDFGAYGDDDAGTDSGAAYVFRTTDGGATYGQVAKLTASDAASGDRFGVSVAIDGDTVVVGASGAAWMSTGEVYVFRTTDGGATYDQVARLAPSDAGSGDLFGTFSLSFGSFVAIAGNTVVVGAYGDVLGTRTSGYDKSWG